MLNECITCLINFEPVYMYVAAVEAPETSSSAPIRVVLVFFQRIYRGARKTSYCDQIELGLPGA